MKKTLFFILTSFALLSLSCSNDFEVTTNWKDIPIVYGLLNMKDPSHYIRLEKAFLDPKANALGVAQIPDSLYYQNAVVKLERMSNGQVFNLQRVDGNTEGYPRESGIFANAPNWLYKIDSVEIALKEGEPIRLRIDRGNGLPDVTAETVILKPLKLKLPSPNGGTFRFDYNKESKITWETSPNGRIFDVKLIIHYTEYEISNPGNTQDKSIEWNWARGLRNQDEATTLSVEKTGIEFYEVLKNNIEVNSALKRIFTGIDVVVIGGGESLEKFINVGLANTGITGSQELPSYTNLSEGKGIFSSIHKLTAEKLLLNASTWDSLRVGYITKNLNF
jgi:hypothetical protein